VRRERKSSHTSKISEACHAIPPAVSKSIEEIPRDPRVSNLPCPERKTRNENNCKIAEAFPREKV
jgi:hypothetical protein